MIDEYILRKKGKKKVTYLVDALEPILKSKRATFLLEDAVQGMMYIPNDLKSISKLALILSS